jgi:hypothetical protein
MLVDCWSSTFDITRPGIVGTSYCWYVLRIAMCWYWQCVLTVGGKLLPYIVTTLDVTTVAWCFRQTQEVLNPAEWTSVTLQTWEWHLTARFFTPWHCKGSPAVCLLQYSIRDNAKEALQSVYWSVHSVILQRKPCSLFTVVFTPWYCKGSPAVCLLQYSLRDIAKEALQSVDFGLHSVILQRMSCSLFTAVFTSWYFKGNPAVCLLQSSLLDIAKEALQSVYCGVHSVILQRKPCSLFTSV